MEDPITPVIPGAVFHCVVLLQSCRSAGRDQRLPICDLRGPVLVRIWSRVPTCLLKSRTS